MPETARGTSERRYGTPEPPYPAWGMEETGDGVAVSEPRPGGGAPRRVHFSVPAWDAVVVLVALLVWTGIFVYFFAPH